MVTATPFGTVDGVPVTLLTLQDPSGVRAELLTLGATLRSLFVPDREGILRDVCLGYDTAEEYRRQDACFGGTIGRCANRVGGASVFLSGSVWSLSANEGTNQLHGGTLGFHHRPWAYRIDGEDAVTFTRTASHLEEGWPGTLTVEVTYRLQGSVLTMDYRAQSDRDTVVNLTNHAYWNLAGHNGGVVTDHVLMIPGERYTPCREGNVPTGELQSVEGTPLDLRTGAPLSQRLGDPFLASTRGFDHNYALSGTSAATLFCPRTGITLEVTTTLPGMQVYTAGFLTERRGKGGAVYGPAHGVCLETQHFPDAVHQAGFPSPVLLAGEPFHETTVCRFSLS